MSGQRRADPVRGHLVAHVRGVMELEGQADRLKDWGDRLARLLLGGGRLLVAGNGGSAAQAQHLTGELVGRYREERPALSAIALHAETSTLSAIANDYGWDEGFARQVRAHGRAGDVLLALSTSGASRNLLAAVRAAHSTGMRAWALTGSAPNPLQRLCDEAVAVPGPVAVVQELHLVAVHLLCEAVDAAVVGQLAKEAAG